ncbi:MAG: hypothetical protein J6D37_08640 [Clostridia bacterium]|nr:hypothetical protein [Clostridia bacterium]
MKEFLAKKRTGFYLQAITALFALVGLIAYSIAGQDSYGFVPMVDVLLALGIVAAVVFCIKDYFGIGPIVVMAFLGSAVGVFLLSRFMYYSHQFYGIASDPMSGAMIATTIGFVGMLVCGIASAFFASEKGGNV